MAAKNDILRDKDGNQIFPATTAEQVNYDGEINVKQAIKRGAVRNKVAHTVASMTDKEQIYVYTGTEDGYTFGNWYYWDGTAWTSGGAYNAIEVNTDGTLTEEGAPADAKATGLRIDSLKSDLDDLDKKRNLVIEIKRNYFNRQDGIMNIVHGGQVGSTVTNVSNYDYWGGIVRVEANKTYVFPRIDFDYMECDENFTILARVGKSQGTKNFKYRTTNVNVKYVAFSIYKYAVGDVPVYKPDDYMVLDENISFDTYIKYPYEIIVSDDLKEELKDELKEKVYYVGSGKDFTTFIGALRALKDDKTPKTIYVMNGVYDIYEELGGKTYLDTISLDTVYTEVSVFVPDNTKIIGLGDVTFNYLPEASDFSNARQVTCVSPLNVAWNCEIENIKIYGRNCRYCIHDEAGGLGDGTPKRIKYKNVVAIKLPNTYKAPEGQTYISGQAYASGMITGYSYEYENCYFKSQENYAWTCHTGEGDYSDTGNIITIKNCVFESPSWAGIRFGSTQGTPTGIQKYCKVSILNSYIQNQILLTREADTAPAPNQYELTLMNCNNVTITDKFAENGWTNIYTPKVFNPIG